MKKSWYRAQFIFSQIIQPNSNNYLFDKREVFFKALNDKDAYQLALWMAAKNLDELNTNTSIHEENHWEFAGIRNLEKTSKGQLEKVHVRSTRNKGIANRYLYLLKKNQERIILGLTAAL